METCPRMHITHYKQMKLYWIYKPRKERKKKVNKIIPLQKLLAIHCDVPGWWFPYHFFLVLVKSKAMFGSVCTLHFKLSIFGIDIKMLIRWDGHIYMNKQIRKLGIVRTPQGSSIFLPHYVEYSHTLLRQLHKFSGN